MPATAVRITGLSQVVRDLQRLGVSTDDLAQAFGEISDGVVREAVGLVEIDTGALQATIRPARTKNKAVVRAGSAAVPYAGVVNYVRPGSEFLTRPANENTDEKVRKIEDNLADLIRRYGLS